MLQPIYSILRISSHRFLEATKGRLCSFSFQRLSDYMSIYVLDCHVKARFAFCAAVPVFGGLFWLLSRPPLPEQRAERP